MRRPEGTQHSQVRRAIDVRLPWFHVIFKSSILPPRTDSCSWEDGSAMAMIRAETEG